MKRHIFYIAAIAAVSLSAAVSSFTIHASSHGKATATEATAAKDAVTEMSADDPAPVAKDRPVVIDFYATWCGPCKTYKPIFDKVAKDYMKKATFIRVDVDQFPDLAVQYRISSIPTTIILTPDGNVYKSVGLLSEAQLSNKIEAALK